MKQTFSRFLHRLRRHRALARIPAAASEQVRMDRQGLGEDPGLEAALTTALAWLCRAQDLSASHDGGVARAYSLERGWWPSYPETTGYIVPTFLSLATQTGSTELRGRSQRMLDWLKHIQLPSGGFQGGCVGATPVVPVVFNTGQILMGLAAGEVAFGTYRDSLRRAADWLVSVQDPDGCWRKHESPFARSGEKTYDTHTAWGLLEAARVEPGRGYGEGAIANVRWALTHQRANGWMDRCCLTDPSQPLTHTLGYSLRGIIEGYRYCEDPALLEAACRLADGLLGAMAEDGFLPGCLRADWTPAASWACLTGTVQIAHCWLMLFQTTGNIRYREAAYLANRYVRRSMRLDAQPDCRGVKGSFPVDGSYSRFEYPNWAAKFLIDSLTLEREVRQAGGATVEPSAVRR